MHVLYRIVQEYCDCGTLVGVASQWALSQGTDQQMVLRLLLLQDCAQGLEVLHGRNVVHGDLVSSICELRLSADARIHFALPRLDTIEYWYSP